MSSSPKNRLSSQERDQRLDADFREAIIKASYEAQDPGLRENFHVLPRLPVRLICCRMVKMINHGGFIRLAEAFRLESVSFEGEADSMVDFGGAKGASDWIEWRWGNPLDEIQRAKDEGYQVVGLTLNDSAQAAQNFSWTFPTALVLGEERFGLTPQIEVACDVCLAIPLFGMITSLNVTHAGVIAVWEASKAYQKAHPDFLPARGASQRLLRQESE